MLSFCFEWCVSVLQMFFLNHWNCQELRTTERHISSCTTQDRVWETWEVHHPEISIEVICLKWSSYQNYCFCNSLCEGWDGFVSFCESHVSLICESHLLLYGRWPLENSVHGEWFGNEIREKGILTMFLSTKSHDLVGPRSAALSFLVLFPFGLTVLQWQVFSNTVPLQNPGGILMTHRQRPGPSKNLVFFLVKCSTSYISGVTCLGSEG